MLFFLLLVPSSHTIFTPGGLGKSLPRGWGVVVLLFFLEEKKSQFFDTFYLTSLIFKIIACFVTEKTTRLLADFITKSYSNRYCSREDYKHYLKLRTVRLVTRIT